jgi:hypothetical protein
VLYRFVARGVSAEGHSLRFHSVCTKLRSNTFSRGARIVEDMTKEASNKQVTVLNAMAQAQANHRYTSMGGKPDFMAGLPQQSTVTFSKKHLCEILRQALEIVESIDDIGESVLESTRSPGPSPTKK